MSRGRNIYLLLLVLWTGFIFVLTSIPNPPHIGMARNMDKGVHFFIYGVSGLILALYLKGGGKRNRVILISTLIFVGLVGGLDEIHQMWISGRAASFYDWMADISGGISGSLAIIFFLHRGQPPVAAIHV